MSESEHSTQTPPWPAKRNLFGVNVSATSYAEATEIAIAKAKRGEAGIMTALACHGLMTAVDDPEYKRRINEFDLVGPDGQPVRKALDWLHRAGLKDRVYGPFLTLWLCERAAKEGVSVYLYGSSKDVVEKMRDNLAAKYPGLIVAGAEPSVFRKLTAEEDRQLVDRINGSGAGIVFIGLGCPLQENFAWEHRHSIKAIQFCVGAAFDFHAKTKKMAPPWMQKFALEWLFRLSQEPRRLFKRYAVTNSKFIVRLFLQGTGLKKYPLEHAH